MEPKTRETKGLKIISMSGFGKVTNNMFVYETDKDIIIIDCGVGFPSGEMLGVDLTIPDVSYLEQESKRSKIRGIVLSHGHDDHIGALPYVLPKLPNVPIYGSRWTLGLVEDKLSEFHITRSLEEVNEKSNITLGNFLCNFVEVPHSIPETYNIVITTPIGVVYHAPDYKLDLTPVMGKQADQQRISQIGQKGVVCLLSDCLRAERPGFTPSESRLEDTFEREIENCQGKFLVTTMSSNISRLKQAIEVSLRHGRKIVLVGRSIEKNVKLAIKMGYLQFPINIFASVAEMKKSNPAKFTLLVAGSQAQSGSALERVVSGEHEVKIRPDDKIVFSTDSIPGNEVAVYSLIDEILLQGADVSYADITSDIHVSGHGQAEDLKKLIELVHPKYLLPIGGNFRHMIAYQKLAEKLGYQKNEVIIPRQNQVVELTPDGKVNLQKSLLTKVVLVDALGVGDVGNVVLRDRQVLASEGIVVLILQVEQGTLRLVDEPDILTRGFVYVRESEELLNETKEEIHKIIRRQKSKEIRFLRRELQENLERFFFKKIGRQPMILSFIIEV